MSKGKEIVKKLKRKTPIEIEYEVIQKEDYYSCYIPSIDSYFSVSGKSKTRAQITAAIKKKVTGLTMLWIKFWNEENKKGTALKPTDTKKKK